MVTITNSKPTKSGTLPNIIAVAGFGPVYYTEIISNYTFRFVRRVRGLLRISLSYNILLLFSTDASIYVSFSPSYRETEEEKKVHFETTQKQIARIMEICGTFIKRDERYLKRVLNHLQLYPNLAAEILEKLHTKVNNYSRKELAPIIRYVLREDYGIK